MVKGLYSVLTFCGCDASKCENSNILEEQENLISDTIIDFEEDSGEESEEDFESF